MDGEFLAAFCLGSSSILTEGVKNPQEEARQRRAAVAAKSLVDYDS